MTVSIEVTDNINKIIERVHAEEKKIELATINALNKTAHWVGVETVKEVSRRRKIPKKVIRRKFKVRKARRLSLRAVISLERSQWVGVAKLGSIKQTPIGAKVRNTMFKGAFIAVMKSGHVGIFRRREMKSTPIDEERINSYAWETIEGIVKNNADRVFEMYFLEQIEKGK